MARKQSKPAIPADPTLEELFNATMASKKAATAATRARTRADELLHKRNKMAEITPLENVLYKDSTGKTWFFDGWTFAEVNG